MIRKNKEYDDILMAFLTGKLLGDGFARKGSSKIDINATGTAFTFAQNIKQLEYIKNMYSLLLEYNLCSDRVPQIESINTKELDLSKRNYKYSLYTTKNPEFDELFNAFYKYDPTTKHYVKGLYDKELISRYFNPFSLAIFTMDDGTNQNSNIKFCTDGFTKADTEWLQDLLLTKFNLKSNLHKPNNRSNNTEEYRIYIVAKSMPKFRELVTPYFIPSMLYKLEDQRSKSPKDNRPFSLQVTDTKTNITTMYMSLRDLSSKTSLSRDRVGVYLRDKNNTKLYKDRYEIIKLK